MDHDKYSVYAICHGDSGEPYTSQLELAWACSYDHNVDYDVHEC